jgi:hypothetical protein
MTGEMDVEISTGLADDADVITGPFKSLRELKDGDRVRIEEPKKGEVGKVGKEG